MQPQILVVSFSDINRDARVLRQLSIVSEYGDVTTVGYGGPTPWSTIHIEVPSSAASLPQTPVGVAMLAARAHRLVELKAPSAQAVKDQLMQMHFDAVVANDARALPLAFLIAKGAPVWADMHEWAPEERTHVASWRILVSPHMDYLCRKYLPRAAAITTVGGHIAKMYEERYGVSPRLMRNIAPYAELSPSKTAPDKIIRLVHSGGAVPGRSLETMIDAVTHLSDRFSLDLYLVPANDGGKYLSSIRAQVGQTTNVALHDPVKPELLPQTLNRYDVGCFWIPPFNPNARFTLPNKIFDYIQARLAIAIGPTVEMASLVNKYGIGTISSGFDANSIARSLEKLSIETVQKYKEASNIAAQTLNFESEALTARRIIDKMLSE